MPGYQYAAGSQSPQSLRVRNVGAGTYSLNPDDVYIICSGTLILNLPSVSSQRGRVFHCKAGGTGVTINPDGTDQIFEAGASTPFSGGNDTWFSFVSDDIDNWAFWNIK